MTRISAEVAYRLWAGTYDHDPNPLLALEHRTLSKRLELAPGDRFMDLATGTGRWMRHAMLRGARAAGVDLCSEMLAVASTKPRMRGYLACADICALPLASDSVDVAVCSFALGYVDRLERAFGEMARIARTTITSDLHPEAIRAGWVRSFRAGGQKFEIIQNQHLWTRMEACAQAAGLRLLWRVDASFEEQDRPLFQQAGKADRFCEAQEVPAVRISAWVRT